MPLKNISPDPKDEYFADGLTEELISTVSKVRELSVISSTSTMQYRTKSKPVVEIGRELNAGTILEGSVRKAGDKVRITVQMIDARNDKHVWAESYDRELQDVFAIQSEIATKIAEELRIQLVDFDRRMLERHPTESTQAYTYFLQARELLRRGDEQSLRGALKLFQRAIELDPSFAKAYSDLADCQLALGNAGYESYQESIANAKVPLKRALELDPNLADAHATLSRVLMNEDDPDEEAEARKAIELNPSLPEPYEWLANIAEVREDTNEILRLIETCYRLDPTRPRYIANLGMAYFYLGREIEALELWRKTEGLEYSRNYLAIAEYYLQKGDFERAKQLHSVAERLDPNSDWVRWLRGYIEAKTGNRDAALLEIRKLEDAKGGAACLNAIGFVYYALGDLDAYFDYLGRALELHAVETAHVMYCPLFAEARTDPRYQALLEKAKKMLLTE